MGFSVSGGLCIWLMTGSTVVKYPEDQAKATVAVGPAPGCGSRPRPKFRLTMSGFHQGYIYIIGTRLYPNSSCFQDAMVSQISIFVPEDVSSGKAINLSSVDEVDVTVFLAQQLES